MLISPKETIFIIIHITLLFMFGVLTLHQSRIVGSGLVEIAFLCAPMALHKNVTKWVCDYKVSLTETCQYFNENFH